MTPSAIADNPLRTRGDLQRLVRDLVEPILPHFSPDCARVTLGANRALYGDPAGLLEAFARPLWGLVPLTAGGASFAHWDMWRAGLDAGTNPEHPEFWGFPRDYDQRSVEAAALGFTLALLPQAFWQTLEPRVRAQAARWLGRLNEVKLVDSNWLFFRVLVNLGLERCGETHSVTAMEADLNRLESFYVGDGWYADGRNEGPAWKDGHLGDYYIPMAFHFYSLIYARLRGDQDPVRAARMIQRARSFAQDFLYWFAEDGSALPYGRSLTYRFAQCAFWGGLAFAPAEALPWGVMKGLYLRNLRWWLGQPIFTDGGLLSIGYAYPNLIMAESYNSPGSPYWAMKAFLPLALAENHPFWQAEETPLPRRSPLRTVKGAGLVLQGVNESRDVVALCPGQRIEDWPRHAFHKYSKFAYSTRFGFTVPTSTPNQGEGGFDSMLALSDDGRRYRIREHALDAEVGEGAAYSRWLPWPDVEVQTWLVALEDAHLRVHRVRTTRKLTTAEAGFATTYEEWSKLHFERIDTGFGSVRSPAGQSSLRDLLGGRKVVQTNLGTNSHLLASLSSMPLLEGTLTEGTHWLVCLASGLPEGVARSLKETGWSWKAEDVSLDLQRDGRLWRRFVAGRLS